VLLLGGVAHGQDDLQLGRPGVHVRIDDAPQPFYLGGRTVDDLPPLTDEELASPQLRRMFDALAGDPLGERWPDHARAGFPLHVRPRAIPSSTPHYGGYWVGGGLPVHGDDPFLDEGTFGWDYFGILFNKRIDLNWSHGRRHQGGAGSYKTDGPKLRHE
jgi:hypothetical protein